jgi:transcriptional regulator with XRE-family HTH domain
MLTPPEKIRRLRRARGWTQAELSERASIPVNYISAIESNAIAQYERRLLEELGYTTAMDDMLSELAISEPLPTPSL